MKGDALLEPGVVVSIAQIATACLGIVSLFPFVSSALVIAQGVVTLRNGIPLRSLSISALVCAPFEILVAGSAYAISRNSYPSFSYTHVFREGIPAGYALYLNALNPCGSCESDERERERALF